MFLMQYRICYLLLSGCCCISLLREVETACCWTVGAGVLAALAKPSNSHGQPSYARTALLAATPDLASR